MKKNWYGFSGLFLLGRILPLLLQLINKMRQALMIMGIIGIFFA
jgi:hypothetical protein